MAAKETIEAYTGVCVPDVDPSDADARAMAEGIGICAVDEAVAAGTFTRAEGEQLIADLHVELGGFALLQAS